MSRARVIALALVNWRGVFYERYLLDRHVTALEGANGAGKTTVMIAAYVVLLPDMSRLRFTNLGETGATGGDRGIWGRLGEPGRPSYAVLDLELAGGERLVAGVHLARASEPTVEPTPFVVRGLPPEVRLHDLLLLRRGDTDHVPELDELKDSAGALGGRIEVFRTGKEYFAALFEAGVTPLRLASDEERTKLNEMLRTSMTGGISRALTSELRSFLLKEETGLADTLSRMRANLDACRRTRAEVAEARHLEREITGVYDAGLGMFSAAVLAARELADEAQQRAAAARAALEEHERGHRGLDEALAGLVARQATIDERIAAARADLERAQAERERRNAARQQAANLAKIEAELAGLTADADAAKAQQTAAADERTARKRERDRAQEAYDRATYGLAHLQEGLEELHRRAHAHRQLRRRLDDARTALDQPGLEPDGAPAALVAVTTRREELDRERAHLDRDARSHDVHAAEHARAVAALAHIEAAGDGPGSGAPHVRARAALARLAEREALVARVSELEREQALARRIAERQKNAVTRARSLGLVTGEPGAAAGLEERLQTVETAMREAEDEARTAEAAATEGQHQLAAARIRRAGLEERADRWEIVAAAARRLAAAIAGDTSGAAERRPGAAHRSADVPVLGRDELLALQARLGDDQLALTAQRRALSEEREQLLREAAALDEAGAAIHPALLRLRDELGGELLASRFEDLDLEAAAWVEARLGPLTDALIVEDPAAAARAVGERPRDLPTVWLVRAGAELDVSAGGDDGRDAIVSDAHGLRVTRPTDRPTLGRSARARQARELRERSAVRGAELDAVAERLHRVASWRRDAEAALALADVLAAGDPAAELAATDAELARLAAADGEQRNLARAARERAVAARGQLDELRRLLAEAMLLEPPDHAARLVELSGALARAIEARAELTQTIDARRTLADLIDVLRTSPPDPTQRAAARARTGELDGERDRLFAAHAALEDVLAGRHAAAWSDAEAALAEKTALAPALHDQHEAARRAVQDAETAVTAAEARWEEATAAAQTAEAARAAAAAHRDRAAHELAALGGVDQTPASDLGEGVQVATRRLVATEAEGRALVESVALYKERRSHAGKRLDEARALLASEEQRSRPAAAAWAALRAAAADAGLLHGVLSHEARGASRRASAALAADASSKRELLIDRLSRARGGDEIARELRGPPLPDGGGGDGSGDGATTDDSGERHLAAWLATRDWLRRRVPAQIAEVDDPLEALERLRDHLDLLESRLERQEGDLRGASEDVARGIEVQLRRARGQVRRLNQHLEGISFGSIAAIRVEMRRVERMEQILRALREGEAQELLFLPSMPIEEALDEIFRRYGGGRSGGQRLLDYREYLELAVEIRRKAGDAWEPASPTRLSTGEAIGVGAALMMVVLTEWERDANLLRARRTPGSLRFLFLDEANRLSRDNLGVLFDLCRTLDLQLLIAAPEVARAEGNTTYRLVRQLTEDGREEVIVSGRRAQAVVADADAEAEMADAETATATDAASVTVAETVTDAAAATATTTATATATAAETATLAAIETTDG